MFGLMSHVGCLLLLQMDLPGHDQLQQRRILASFVMGREHHFIIFLGGVLFE